MEQILPHGPDHPFAKTMLSHFDKLKTPPKSVGQYPTLESQRHRFQSRGWRHVDIWDLWEAWSSDYFLSSAERVALDQVEPFDEWEEFMLFARHYFIIHAAATQVDDEHSSQATAPAANPGYAAADVEVTCHQVNAPRRRFGDVLTTKTLPRKPICPPHDGFWNQQQVRYIRCLFARPAQGLPKATVKRARPSNVLHGYGFRRLRCPPRGR